MKIHRHESPKVSVVIPVYNKAPFVKACLESVSSQSLADIEIICVDDCSTDGSFEIAVEHSNHDRRVVIMRNGTNVGPGVARNVGVAAASAPFVQFTDADDLLPRRSLEILFELATSDSVPLVRGSLANFSCTHAEAWPEPSQAMQTRHNVTLNLERRLWIPYFHVCYLFSTQFLAAEQLAYPNLRSGEDPVFLASCLVNAPQISTTSEVTYLYRRDVSPNRTNCAAISDFLRHVGIVKEIYTNSADNALCWSELCDDFYLQEMRRFIGMATLTEREGTRIAQGMRELWPNSAGEYQMRNKHAAE